MPNITARSGRFNPRVVALVYDGLCAFEFSCTAEVFGLSRPEMGPRWYRFETCSVNGRQVRGQYGMTMHVDGDLNRLASAGTIMIPGWRGVDAPVPVPIIEALRCAHGRGARLLSICSGSFVLAATGLLDGKRATTHWRYAEALQARFPRIHVDAGVLYVDEGQILTSAGSAAGLDLCLHLIRRDHGVEAANHVARRLVIQPHRDGGQAQFLERPVDTRERGSLAAVLDKLRNRLHKPLTIAKMARLAAMSERTFMRRFRAATGMTPGEWIIRARVDLARELLEQSALPMDQVAMRAGLGTPSTMRHHFHRNVGVSPAQYRKRFSNVNENDSHLQMRIIRI